jgi:hypothetical protein
VFSLHTARSNAAPVVRISPKVLLSTLLVLSAIPLIFAPLVSSQQVFKTITTQTTNTITNTINHQSSVTITVATTQTVLVTTVTLTTLRLAIGVTSGACVTEAIELNSPQQTIHVEYSSNAPIDMWAFSDLMWLQLWYDTNFHLRGADPCNPGIGPTYGYATYNLARSQTIGSANFLMGAGGKVLYIVYHRDVNPNVTPVVRLSVNGLSMAVTMTSTSSIIFQETQTQTVTATMFETREVPFLEANASWLIPLALVVIVAVLLFATWPRKRRRSRT